MPLPGVSNFAIIATSVVGILGLGYAIITRRSSRSKVPKVGSQALLHSCCGSLTPLPLVCQTMRAVQLTKFVTDGMDEKALSSCFTVVRICFLVASSQACLR